MSRHFAFPPNLFGVLLGSLKARARAARTDLPEYVIKKVGIYRPTFSRWMKLFEAGKTVVMQEHCLEAIGITLDTGDPDATYNRVMEEAKSIRLSPREPRPGIQETKMHIDVEHQDLSVHLLDAARQPPAFVDVVRRVRPALFTDATKDAGVIGEPPYTHIVQMAAVLTLNVKAERRILCCHRRELADTGCHERTLGCTVLFTKPLFYNFKDIDSPLDDWLNLLTRLPDDAVQSVSSCRRGVLPLPMAMLKDQLIVPSGVEFRSVNPAWVITNNQIGRLSHRGTEMRTVYTSYVFHIDLDVPSRITYDPMRFRSGMFDQSIADLSGDLTAAEAEQQLTSSKDNRLNVMDYLAVLALRSSEAVLTRNSDHGNAFLRRGFLIV